MTAAVDRPALEVQALVKEFTVSRGTRLRTVRAVDGLDLIARHGQVTALLGPNGAGKTTTLECAQGLLKPTAGRIRLLGEDPWNAGPRLRARAGVMLQDGGLPQSARPGEYLRHISSMYRRPADMPELMDRLAIHSFAKTPLRRLSGGQRQRVALAAALAGRPQIVFLDEPSAGLDPQSRGVVFELIDQLRREGTAVVLTTHLLDDAQRLADHVVIVDHGRVRAAGSVAELIAGDGATGALRVGLTSTQREQWLTQPPHLPGRHGTVVAAALTEDQLVLTGELGTQTLSALTQWLAATGQLPVSLSLQPRTLEDVFLEIAGREIR